MFFLFTFRFFCAKALSLIFFLHSKKRSQRPLKLRRFLKFGFTQNAGTLQTRPLASGAGVPLLLDYTVSKKPFWDFRLNTNSFFINLKNQHKLRGYFTKLNFSFFIFASSYLSLFRVLPRSCRLPSGQSFFVSTYFLCSLPQSKFFFDLRPKSSCFFFKKKRIGSRGVAQNACDHPNGGKGRSGVIRGF